MKRKVNLVGQNTLTVSLPSNWVKKNNISKGNELNVDEEKNSIILRTSRKKEYSEIDIDLTNLKSMLNRTICAIYKAGFRNVKLRYSTDKELEIIENTLDRTCHVFEIMDIKKGTVDVETISSLDPKDFNTVFRKMGFAILDIADETLNAIKKKDFEHSASIISKDRIVDRHTDFCRRILNAGHQVDYDRPFPLYVIAEQTEILADIYKSLNQEISSKKIVLEKDLIKLLEEINSLVKIFYDVLYNFEFPKIVSLGEKEVFIRKEIDKISNKKRNDSKVLGILINIFETAFEMKSALLTLKVK